MDRGDARKNLWGAVLLGVLIGFLFLSKSNYHFVSGNRARRSGVQVVRNRPWVIISLAALLAIARHVGLVTLSQALFLATGTGVAATLLVLAFANPAYRR